MKLYHSPTSPYVRKVMVTLDLTGQLGEVELIPGSGTPLAPNDATIGINPLGKIPCLIGDSPIGEGGVAIFDSRVICRYLDHRAKAGLYPEGDALFPVLTAEALADAIMMTDVEPPLVVGVLGGWGSGKSFVLHLLKKLITDECKDRRGELGQTKGEFTVDQTIGSICIETERPVANDLKSNTADPGGLAP